MIKSELASACTTSDESPVHSAELSSCTDNSSIEESLCSILDEIQRSYSEDKIPAFVASLKKEMLEAYTEESHRSMIHTITPIPTCEERGRFLVVDIGGSTTKVSIIDIGGGKYNVLAKQTWEMEQDRKVIDEAFFERMAERTASVLATSDFFAKGETIPVGFSWSFPFEQTKPNNAFINVVSKGYTIADKVKGGDIGQLFTTAMKKHQAIDVQVLSVINDAVAVYISGLYEHACQVGLVMGTGINGSFTLGGVVLNVELSFFGSSMLEPLGNDVIDGGVCPNFRSIPANNYMHYSTGQVYQPLEYLSSGRYLGEMFRLGMLHGISTGELLASQEAKAQASTLAEPYEVSSLLVSQLSEADYKQATVLLLDAFGVSISESDWILIERLIAVLTDRAALVLTCAALASAEIVREVNPHSAKQTDSDQAFPVGYVGSLLEHYTAYKDITHRLLNRYAPGENLPPILLHHINDSSILGAAVSAATYKSLKEKL